MEEAEFLADVIGIFEHGRLVCMGTADELKTRFEQVNQLDHIFHEL